MIFALMLALVVLLLTGLVVLGGAEKQGPLRAFVSFATGSLLRQWHELAAYGLLALIAAHVSGVILESRRTGENLPRAMVTGFKRTETAVPVIPARPLMAAVLSTLLGLAIALPLVALWRVTPTTVPQEPLDASYAKDCGDCHNAFHPSLLTAATWTTIMAGLDDHFGEDATLKPDVTAALSSYLAANAAEHWDTRPANAFRQMGESDPLRITATPYWTRRHRGIDPAVFKFEKVGTKSNCEACHGDARQGLFTPQAIHIPES